MKTIGRNEWIDLPELGLFHVKAKIDTGAYTSSMHCENIEEKENSISCEFLNPDNPENGIQNIIFTEFSKKRVKSSNGIEEERYLVSTEITIGSETSKIKLTLTNRKDMRSPLLLGRKFLRKKYIVDVSHKNILNK